VERNITASRKQPGPSTEDFVLHVYRKDGQRVQVLGQKLISTQAGEREIELTMAESKIGEELFLQVHAKAATNLVPLRATSSVKIEAMSRSHRVPTPESTKTPADSKRAPISALAVEEKEAATLVVSSVDADRITEERKQTPVPKLKVEKKNEPAITVVSIPPIIQNGTSARVIQEGGLLAAARTKVKIVIPGFEGSGNKVIFTVPRNSSGSVWLFSNACLRRRERLTS
jgi:hypothetical protein